MKTINAPAYLFILFLTPFFSELTAQHKENSKSYKKVFYLDSIKKTFVRDSVIARVDSLWMDEVISLSTFNNFSKDIDNVNKDQKTDLELPTELLKLRLAEMNSKSPFNIEYNSQVENVIKSFLKYRKKSFEGLMVASEYYFPLFEEALTKENIPLEIKYLAVVESALNPKAVSKMGATGLWQFMYHTGKQYNLKIDNYVDERHDPLKSTEAAAKYMASMYKAFGDWDLVLAAYNSGPGNVSKAIKRSGGQKNYWNIRKHLPRETQGYVPAFLATMYLFEYHDAHGIKPEKTVVKHFTTDTIMIKKKLSFKQISDLIDIPVKKLEQLNPSYKLNIIPVYNDHKHYLRLPHNKVTIFTSNEEKIYAYAEHQSNMREKPLLSSQGAFAQVPYSKATTRFLKTKYYTVKKGDTLGQIAKKYSISVSDIKKWNKINGDMLPLGKNLKIMTN